VCECVCECTVLWFFVTVYGPALSDSKSAKQNARAAALPEEAVDAPASEEQELSEADEEEQGNCI
jgi:hypothetical protein